MRFITTDQNDFIQNHWVNNTFYEQEELSFVRQFIPSNAVIIDVGANVGNHAMFFDKMYSPKVVYAIEPNSDAYMVMLMNAALNHCHSINFDYIGCVLSNTNGSATKKSTVDGNLGATSFEASSDGIRMVTGDSLFADKHVDLIKIDVEGMEFDVLEGFNETIMKSKPYIYIEVLNSMRDRLDYWMEQTDYKIVQTLSVYDSYSNYLLARNDKTIAI